MSESIPSSVVFGLPFCHRSQGEQTSLSKGLRITALAVGAIAVVLGALMVHGLLGPSSVGVSIGWAALSAGGVSLILASTLRFILQAAAEGTELIEPQVRQAQREYQQVDPDLF